MLRRNISRFLPGNLPAEEIAMNTRLFDQWVEVNKAAFAPVVRWQELAAETAQKLVQHNLAVGKDFVDLGTRQWQLLGEARDPQKFAAEGSKLAAEYGQKLVDRTGDFFKVAKETQEAVGSWADQAAKAGVEALNAFNAKPV
jgi:phasin family protein